MTQRANPWWFSGDDPAPSEPSAGPGGALPNVDWSALASGAQRLVDWASERVMAPHAGHADPRDHPDCIVCRTMRLLGDRSPAPDRDTVREPDAEGASEAEEIAWITIVDRPDQP